MAISSQSETDSVDDRQERHTAEIYATDQQVRDAKLLEAVSEAIRRPGLPLTGIVTTVMDAYADRPALGERAKELTTDPATGRTSLRLLPRFDTISYGELCARVGAVAAEWHHDPQHPRAGDLASGSQPGDHPVPVGGKPWDREPLLAAVSGGTSSDASLRRCPRGGTRPLDSGLPVAAPTAGTIAGVAERVGCSPAPRSPSAMNPQAMVGQVHGGAAQGLGSTSTTETQNALVRTVTALGVPLRFTYMKLGRVGTACRQPDWTVTVTVKPMLGLRGRGPLPPYGTRATAVITACPAWTPMNVAMIAPEGWLTDKR